MALATSPIKSNPPSTKEGAPEPTDGYTRLHITPLDQDLLKIVVPAAVLPNARNLSLHTIETFPERRYGFVDLPAADAEKLKRKLNGTTLKGAKMRIEKARLEERPEPTGHALHAGVKKRKAVAEGETPKRRKRDPNVIEGVVLKDRQVKRGWTESTDTKVKNKRNKDKSSSKDKDQERKRKRPKSKYTDQDECLLKTRLPPNAVGNLPPNEAYKKKKKRGNSREVTVHEFEKTTTFPSFLKNVVPDREGKEAVEFVDGKGWVDEDGKLVEAVKTKEMATTPKPKSAKRPVEQQVEEQESSHDDSTSSSGTSSEEEDSGFDTSDAESSKDMQTVQKERGAVVEENSSDTSSSSSKEENDEDEDEETPTAAQEDSRPLSSSSSRSLTIKIPPPITPAKVHPLEALYKRPKPHDAASTSTPAPVESFSFFAGGDQDDDIEEDPPSLTVPMTPFGRQDFERRNIRSAAPTPDTAHPSRMKTFWAPENEGEDVVDEEEEEEEAQAERQQGTNDFQSWFWENRRDLNKSWMTRRKAAAKEKRHRENKSRASKAI